jgi:hypothetical protein
LRDPSCPLLVQAVRQSSILVAGPEQALISVSFAGMLCAHVDISARAGNVFGSGVY